MTDAALDHLPGLLSRLQTLRGDAAAVRQSLEQAALDHPGDPRVFLLLGAERVHGKDIDGAEAAYIAALQLAPDFGIARFQLGLLQLTSARPAAAMSTWAPLDALDETHPLRLFKRGLECVARDEFEEARRWLLAGIARNQENPPLNQDMRMVLDRIAQHAPGQAPSPEEQPAQPTDDHFLVSSYRKPN